MRAMIFKSYCSPREIHLENERTSFSAVGRFRQAQFRADSVSRHVNAVPAPLPRQDGVTRFEIM